MSETQLKSRDFRPNQEVRWCPGCGDYAILNATQQAFAEIGIPKEDIVIVSGIGCSSRFPYYIDTYGFHSIHGRALAIATGVKVANPDLSVWVATGDGDAMSIGGNHLIHALRRNVDIKILMFNNEIYGLTKGQYSPTSPRGKKTKTSPFGSLDHPFHPLELALGAGASFVARTMDTQPKHMKEVLLAAAAHKGSAFVEIWQNCIIFNDGAFKDWTHKDTRDDNTVVLRPGQPMVFGKDNEKGLHVDCHGNSIVSAKEAMVWDPGTPTPVPAYLLAALDREPDMPRAVGIFRDVALSTYEQEINDQIAQVQAGNGESTLRDLIYTQDAWTVD
ncbi:2-oxoacid:ferredoxin oxidoreductase subunit beta [bacterium]|nr:2-oxoacid:ferredoxin oxidoreductase subunit beta [bacterium]MBU1074082.1 2-oxoacid:ferredoxin oxidoreductase subunit beta [bacterium]MBU1676951.1 2-oxoacid:ferredoxin oxidoreductase subunit beta [bacterium]